MSNRLTLDEAIRIVEEWGGPLLWQCEKLHTWQTSFNVIKYQNTWCPYYVRDKRKLTLEDAKQFAFNKCLSTKYKNSKNLLLWAM
nr:1580_t:CDS:2 [Entrophospora candida]